MRTRALAVPPLNKAKFSSRENPARLVQHGWAWARCTDFGAVYRLDACRLGNTSRTGSCFADTWLVMSQPLALTAKSSAPEGCQYAWMVLSQHILNLLPCYCCPLAKGPILAHILHPVIECAPESNKRGALLHSYWGFYGGGIRECSKRPRCCPTDISLTCKREGADA